MTRSDHLSLLNEPVAQSLLSSKIPARLAYTSLDGSPRVIPIWFHWNGQQFVLGTPPTAPKVKALARNPKVALTIDENALQPKVLLIRGNSRTEVIDGVVPEYAESARRFMGEEQGRAWVEQVGGMFKQMVRIAIQPEWVKILDFETRFPSAFESVIKGGS